ncbi:MAG TPA: hypothetical protein PL082_09955 [Tepidiformaceae bacterium]|nr:hypothetical protein [Tepidiformaceae bacterium]
MGFVNTAEYAQAREDGQTWVTQFRKLVASATTTTNAWIDYTYSGGSPSANFYASSPLEAAEVETARGIYVPSVAPASQYLKNLMVMTAASSATSTANGRQELILCDYLLYYPFIDTDAVGEEQTLTNSVVIPRYSGGFVVAVAQSAGSAIGTFTFTYTNQDGTPGRVSPANRTFAVAGGGQIVGSGGAGASYYPFLDLQAGDTGVRSIESVTMSVAGGGLMALVIVRPLLTAHVQQECRRTTSSNLESYGAASEFSSLIHHQPPRIIDGAVLGILGCGFSGSLASSTLVGIIETIWN